MVVSLLRALEADLGPLSPTLFFEYQSLDALADYLLRMHLAALIERKRVKIEDSTLAGKHATPVVTDNSRYKGAEHQAPSMVRPFRLETQSTYASSDDKDIAIIGLRGRYPQAEEGNKLWQNLKTQKDALTEIPAEGWA